MISIGFKTGMKYVYSFYVLMCHRDPYHLTRLLKELSPRHIIIYDPSVEFVRQLEIHKANNPDRFLRVYFLFYDSSVEEQVLIYRILSLIKN